MTQIILQKRNDGDIWATSDEDYIWQDVYDHNMTGEDDEKCQFLLALSMFLNVAIAV